MQDVVRHTGCSNEHKGVDKGKRGLGRGSVHVKIKPKVGWGDRQERCTKIKTKKKPIITGGTKRVKNN